MYFFTAAALQLTIIGLTSERLLSDVDQTKDLHSLEARSRNTVFEERSSKWNMLCQMRPINLAK
jgi:hypothetical protein